jgi:hypothetical protein
VPRKYGPIWQRIKEEDIVEVQVVHPVLVQRVKQGVIKEKHMDIGWRIMNDTFDYRLQISYNSTTHVLTFRLVQRFGVSQKVV